MSATTTVGPPAGGPHYKSLIACNIGVCLEGFDFVAYTVFAFIISKAFFPAADPWLSTLLSFGSLGVAYVVRPLGGLYWGLYADKHGRRAALSAIAILMAVGTALIAVTPEYRVIGLAAPLLIVLARMLQGFAASGEFASATAMLVELAPPHRQAFYASTQMATQALTIGIAVATVLILSDVLTPQALESWGWRVVFAIGTLIGPVGLYMRARMAESPEFLRLAQRHGVQRRPLREILGMYRKEMLCLAGLIVIGSASFYLILVFLPVYATRQLGISAHDAQVSTIACAFAQSLLCLYAGALADRHGRVAVLLPAALAYAALSYPLFAYLIDRPSFTSLLVVQMAASVILGFVSGPLPAAMSELLPAQVRSTGLGFTYNVVAALFGGLGPFFITALVGLTGDPAGPAYWALFTGIIGAAAILVLRFSKSPPGAAQPAHP